MRRYCHSNARVTPRATRYVVALPHRALVVRPALFDASNDSAIDRALSSGKTGHATIPKGARERRQRESVVVRHVREGRLFPARVACVQRHLVPLQSRTRLSG